MKKLIREILKPEKSFNEWALDNNLIIKEEYTTPPYAKKKIWKWFLSSAVGFILCLLIILPIFLVGDKIPPVKPPTDKVYMDEIETIYITKEEFYKLNLLFFKDDHLVTYKYALIEFSGEDNIILSYYLDECIISVDDENVFYVDYRIRTYKNYKFVGNNDFDNLEYLFENNGIKVYYTIKEFGNKKFSFIKFIYNNYEYFLSLSTFEGSEGVITEITKNNIENFILRNLIFIGR